MVLFEVLSIFQKFSKCLENDLENSPRELESQKTSVLKSFCLEMKGENFSEENLKLENMNHLLEDRGENFSTFLIKTFQTRKYEVLALSLGIQKAS